MKSLLLLIPSTLNSARISRRFDPRQAMGTLKLPVHVIFGRQDRITQPALSLTLADTISVSNLQWVADAGHMLTLANPRARGAVFPQMLLGSE